MADGNPSASIVDWDRSEQTPPPRAQAVPTARGARPQELAPDDGEPFWAQPLLDCLLAERTEPSEQEVFGQLWPSPLPDVLPGIPDVVPDWAIGVLDCQEPEPGEEAQNWDRDDPSISGAWAQARSSFEQGTRLKARVTGCNKGGLLVSVHHLQGFVPASQLICFPRHLDTSARDAYLAQQKGAELEVAIIELDQDRNRLVLSERAIALDTADGSALLETLTSGDVVEGLVSNLCDFGAFVDLGGIDGLIHVSEISWQRIRHPEDILRVGDRVRVHVLSVDKEQRRVALSLKRLARDPWQSISDRYSVGQVVEGVITNIVDFGAFASIEEGLEGLIHVSEINEGEIANPRDLLTEGQRFDLRILRIDGANHRLALSIWQALHPPDGTLAPT